MPDAPALAGIHHLKLPVTDLARSREWYQSRLGYRVQMEFVEQGTLMGYALAHPNGGPPLGLRLSPELARAAAASRDTRPSSSPMGGRRWACGLAPNVPGRPRASTTSPSACPTRRRSTSSPPG